MRLFQQAHAHTHHHRAGDLVGRGLGIDDAARVDHRHHAAHAQPRNLRLPLHFNKLRAIGVQRNFLGLRIFPRRHRLAFGAHAVEPGHLQDVGEVRSVGWRPDLSCAGARR